VSSTERRPSAAERERRERLRRDRDRRRAQHATTPVPSRKQRPVSPAPTAVRERHEGLVGWVVRTVRAVPDAIAGAIRGFLREVLGIFVAAARGVLRFVPGSRFLLDRAPATAPARARGGATATAGRSRSPEEQARRARRLSVVRRRVRLAMAAVGVATVVAGWFVVPGLSAFDVRHVEVLGASSVSDLDVRVGIDELLDGETIYTADAGAISRRVEELPFVESAEVDSHFPGGLSVTITEYRPLALALGDGDSWLVARDGRILAKADQDDWVGRIPVVRLLGKDLAPGVRVSEEPALQLLGNLPPSSTLTFELLELAGRLDSGVEVRFGRPEGAADLRTKAVVAETLMSYARTRAKLELSYIDVSVPERAAYCAKKVGACNITAAEQARADAAAKASPDGTTEVATGEPAADAAGVASAVAD
jgi:cell division septal protein FtsQ